MLRLTYFQMRQLLRTPFFVQQTWTGALGFGLLVWMGSVGTGVAVPTHFWLFATIAGLWTTTCTSAGIVGFQRFQGTLEHIAMTTERPGLVFATLPASSALIGLVGLPLSLGLQMLISGSLVVTSGMLLGLAAAIVACVSSGCLLAALFVVTRNATVFEPLILIPAWLLAGIVVPFVSLPEWLRIPASVLPLSGAVRAATEPHWSGSTLWAAVSLATSVVCFALARFAMKAALRRARTDGTLSLS